eukprot:jgi/Chlat1/7509/Chrsp61S07025
MYQNMRPRSVATSPTEAYYPHRDNDFALPYSSYDSHDKRRRRPGGIPMTVFALLVLGLIGTSVLTLYFRQQATTWQEKESLLAAELVEAEAKLRHATEESGTRQTLLSREQTKYANYMRDAASKDREAHALDAKARQLQNNLEEVATALHARQEDLEASMRALQEREEMLSVIKQKLELTISNHNETFHAWHQCEQDVRSKQKEAEDLKTELHDTKLELNSQLEKTLQELQACLANTEEANKSVDELKEAEKKREQEEAHAAKLLHDVQAELHKEQEFFKEHAAHVHETKEDSKPVDLKDPELNVIHELQEEGGLFSKIKEHDQLAHDATLRSEEFLKLAHTLLDTDIARNS